MKTIKISDTSKIIIDGNIVQYFELIHVIWEAITEPEEWTPEMIKEWF